MVPGGRPDRVHGRRTRPAGSRPATPSSTAATRTFTTMSGGRRRCRASGFTTSTPARAAASGACRKGYCLMVGGDADVCRRLEPIFLTLAPPDGYLRVGGHGAGHYVKMIHNGIEYGLMQAYAEGFELMHEQPLRDRPRRRRRPLDARQRRPVVAAGAGGAGARRGSGPLPAEGIRRGFRRRTLDAAGRHRARRPAAGPDRGALHAVPLARRTIRSASACWRRCATSSAATR